MVGITGVYVFDDKVVNNEGKCDISSFMFPERGGAEDGVITKFGETVAKLIVRQSSCLF